MKNGRDDILDNDGLTGSSRTCRFENLKQLAKNREKRRFLIVVTMVLNDP